MIRQESTDYGEKVVEIYQELHAYDNYCYAGEDFHAGDCLIPAGTKIGAVELGIITNIPNYEKKSAEPVFRLDQVEDVIQILLKIVHIPRAEEKTMEKYTAEFTHFNEQGNAIMVDVSEKQDTVREASACGTITMSRECFEKVQSGGMKKGDVLGVARIAGIMAAKKTYELIPLCHILKLTKVELDFTLHPEKSTIEALCRVKTVDKTGVEMEALTGVNLALLTIYDMCKAIDKTMEIGNIYLEHKSGGKSGDFRNLNK